MEYNMSNENHNNLKPWKDKLEALEKLPGDGFDKAASWEKLYGRLNKKEPRKKLRWFWIAAACLAFALIISMFLFKNTPDKITASAKKSATSQPQKPVAKVEAKNAEAEKIDSITLQKKAVAIDKIINSKSYKITPVRPLLKVRLPDTVSEQNLTLQPGNHFINPDNTLSHLAIAKPVKKKLQVVHLNELGDPVEEMTGLEKNVSTHYFEIKFANQAVYTNPPVSKEKRITILKINTPVN